MTRPLALVCAALVLLLARPVLADSALDSFARDVDRTESVRAVKDLQSNYAQYAQFGLWNEVGALFSPEGSFVFDGLIKPAETAKGPVAIAAFLRSRYGGGYEGLKADGLSSMFIDAPVVNLAADGNSAKARWQTIIFHGHGSTARIEGGVYVNEYARERGVWKIARVNYYPQYDGPYEDGWINWGGGDIPVAPYHYDPTTAGIPIPPAVGAAPVTRASLAQLQKRVDTLNDIDRVRNLQSAYGYYADRRMWDDVVDLFAKDGVVEVGGQGVWHGAAGVRKWLDSIGKAGLSHGQLNDRLQHDVTVTIAAGGNEAFARGLELGMLGEADQEKGWWEVAVFRNRFVKEDGVWKIRELRRFVLMKTDIFQGWGRNRIVEAAPAGAHAPDASLPAADVAADVAAAGLTMPAFLGVHPVTGKALKPAGNAKLVAAKLLTGAIAAGKHAPVALDEARRRLARSAAYDGIANISAAYGYYVDDSNAAGWANTMAIKGFKETPFAGYHIGRERLIAARVRGKGPDKQAGISYHWLLQPMVLVSDDGRSATGRFKLFQPRTGKTVGKEGDFLAAQFWGGMYHDRYVLENGAWKIWELTLDEPYIVPVAWKDGVWARSKDPATPRTFAANADVDVPIKQLVRREQHFWGGTGDQLQWPSILPMWFTYTNPVSGRVPEFHQPDCVPCGLRPEVALNRNGYQEPPDAPAANRSP
ncbi:MAG TPA: nuclear transport factor 2 family protein [Steroidobacteraceae bacterium]|nr:nuclear transport factor 2 family protein [Steroidobacteraceae bacterium]